MTIVITSQRTLMVDLWIVFVSSKAELYHKLLIFTFYAISCCNRPCYEIVLLNFLKYENALLEYRLRHLYMCTLNCRIVM